MDGMQGIKLETAKGVLELYEQFNRSGQWNSKQVQLINEFRGNALLECRVPKDSFGGPYLDVTERRFHIWEIPIKVEDYAFSWQLLARDLFAKFNIPNHRFNDGHTHPEDYKKFSRILRRKTKNGKGKKFIDAVWKKEERLAKILFNEVSGIKYIPSHSHNREGRPFLKGDKFTAVVNLMYTSLENLEKNKYAIAYGMMESQEYDFLREHEKLIIPSSRVNALIRRM